MTPRRIPILVLFFAFVGALVCWRQENGNCAGACSLFRDTIRLIPDSEAAPMDLAHGVSGAISAHRREQALDAVVAWVKPSDAALMTEIIELRQLSEGVDFTLTEPQWSAFAEIALFYQAVRSSYEAEIATVHGDEAGNCQVKIPAYTVAGAVLRDRFFSDLKMTMGDSVADEIILKLGKGLEKRFAGFGVAMQTLEFSRNGDEALSDSAVTRTATYWNSADASGVHSLQETSFPSVEDPDNVRWGPLLARVESVFPKKSRG